MERHTRASKIRTPPHEGQLTADRAPPCSDQHSNGATGALLSSFGSASHPRTDVRRDVSFRSNDDDDDELVVARFVPSMLMMMN